MDRLTRRLILWLLLAVALVPGCDCDSGDTPDGDAGGDGDSGGDADSDADGDSDADADGSYCGADVLIMVDDYDAYLQTYGARAEIGRLLPGFLEALVAAGVDARVAGAWTWDALHTRLGKDNPCSGNSGFVSRSGTFGCPDPLFEELAPAWIDAWDPAASELIACAAVPAEDGCRISVPIHSLRRLLMECPRGSKPACVGFFRSDALAAALVLTNQDDCEAPGTARDVEPHVPGYPDEFYSMSDPANFNGAHDSYEPCETRAAELRPMTELMDKLLTVDMRAANLVLSVAAGPDMPITIDPDQEEWGVLEAVPACDSEELDTTIWPAPRLHDAVEILGDNGRIRDLCEGPESIAAALDDLLDMIVERQDPACLEP